MCPGSGKLCRRLTSKNLEMFKHAVSGARKPDQIFSGNQLPSKILEENCVAKQCLHPVSGFNFLFSLLPSVSFL